MSAKRGGQDQASQERGFELLVLEDPVAFRFAYESRFRERFDRGEAAHLVVVRKDQGNLHSVPYDLLAEADASGRVLSFSFSDLFPALAPNVLAELEYGHLDALARAVDAVAPEKLGTKATAMAAHVTDRVWDLRELLDATRQQSSRWRRACPK